MRSFAKLLVGLALALASSLAVAQSNLGELLDAGATRVSAEDFRRDIVQRTVAGPTPTGGTIEVMFVTNGTIQGMGTLPAAPQTPFSFAPIGGQWTIDDGDRVCAAMQILSPQFASVILPKRCQAWFKLGNDYFLSDSDTDRRAKVLPRSIKAASAAVTAQSNLGQVLDAGGRKLSAAEFRRDLAQRTITGPSSTGTGAVEILYAANGSILGIAQAFGASAWNARVSGDWTIDDDERVCSTMQIHYPVTGSQGVVLPVEVIPRRCDFWYKLGETYFASGSDSDRGANVLRRTIKP